MKTADQNLENQFAKATQEIAASLPKADGLSVEKCRQIIRHYTAAIEGNFVAWMGTAVITAKSQQGRSAASENLWVEMKDNHAGMLHEFAKSAGAEPGGDDFLAVQDAVADVRTLISEMSGLKNLTLMATLENTSAAFVPWLAELAKKCGSDNLKYPSVHGEADIEHADQFVLAVQYEQEHSTSADNDIRSAIEATKKFLHSILQ